MIGRPASVGVMLDDFQIGAVAGEAVENIGCLMRRGRDHVDVVRRTLVGNMSVEAEAMIDAIAGVDIAADAPRFAPLKNWPSELDVAPSPIRARMAGGDAR